MQLDMDIVGSLNTVLDVVDVVGMSIIGKLGGINGTGFKLLCILYAMMFSFFFVIFLLEQNGKIMVNITKLTITWAIIASMLAAWTTPASTGFMKNVSVAGFFLKAIPDIADEFTGGEDPTASIVDKHVAAMGGVFNVLLKGAEIDEEEKPGIGSRVLQGVQNAYEVSKNLFSDPLGSLISLVLLCLAAFFILWSLVTYVFILNAGQIMLYVGLAIGPVLIPFILVERLSFLFEGWLKFMISGALFKVIAVIVSLLCIGVIDAIGLYSRKMATGDESMIFLSLMVLFFSMMGKQMMGMADNIATTLATGGANSGGAGASGGMLVAIGRLGSSMKSKNKDFEYEKLKK